MRGLALTFILLTGCYADEPLPGEEVPILPKIPERTKFGTFIPVGTAFGPMQTDGPVSSWYQNRQQRHAWSIGFFWEKETGLYWYSLNNGPYVREYPSVP